MEKNNSKASKCNPFCEKLLKALKGHPNVRKFRPLSNRQRQQESKPASPCVPPIVSIQERIRDNKELAPSYSLQIHVQEDNARSNMEKKQKPKLEQAVGKEGKHVGGNLQGEDINDVFTGYINRARHKLRSMSSKGPDCGKKPKKESVKDEQFSDYIRRAKNKLRATSSSVGFSKGSSMKRE